MLELGQDEDTGEPLTAQDYLEKCLKDQEGFSQKIAEKNRIRGLIRAFFRERHCFTLIRPCDEEKEL